MMEVGPLGLYLTEASASAPAASVGIATAHPLPSANPVTARGLTALARPPPVVGPNTPGQSDGTSKLQDQSVLPDWAIPFSHWDQSSPISENQKGSNKVGQ
ncbi:unnamed protein product [Echinostoma caproni]|uniref:ICA69 domain-containing protein n=1 Tax=Echinostoma caproni TaxID=27848 RepID=A0A183A4A7_9TREM|nr:unnamed protein product [Echinostoma caproni]